MTLWIDAQLSPHLAAWITEQFGVAAAAVRDLGLRDARDVEIFRAARAADAVVLTKDADFPALLAQLGPPPRIIWLTCGNLRNAGLRAVLASALPEALALVATGESLVQIAAPPAEPARRN
jgi:predicted nuclease of predicted toxin-antitoxin system